MRYSEPQTNIISAFLKIGSFAKKLV